MGEYEQEGQDMSQEDAERLARICAYYEGCEEDDVEDGSFIFLLRVIDARDVEIARLRSDLADARLRPTSSALRAEIKRLRDQAVQITLDEAKHWPAVDDLQDAFVRLARRLNENLSNVDLT